MNLSEQEELKYLNQILVKINKSITEIDERVETLVRRMKIKTLLLSRLQIFIVVK